MNERTNNWMSGRVRGTMYVGRAGTRYERCLSGADTESGCTARVYVCLSLCAMPPSVCLCVYCVLCCVMCENVSVCLCVCVCQCVHGCGIAQQSAPRTVRLRTACLWHASAGEHGTVPYKTNCTEPKKVSSFLTFRPAKSTDWWFRPFDSSQNWHLI